MSTWVAGRWAFAAPRPGCPQGTPLRWFWWLVGRRWALRGRPVDIGWGGDPAVGVHPHPVSGVRACLRRVAGRDVVGGIAIVVRSRGDGAWIPAFAGMTRWGRGNDEFRRRVANWQGEFCQASRWVFASGPAQAVRHLNPLPSRARRGCHPHPVSGYGAGLRRNDEVRWRPAGGGLARPAQGAHKGHPYRCLVASGGTPVGATGPAG